LKHRIECKETGARCSLYKTRNKIPGGVVAWQLQQPHFGNRMTGLYPKEEKRMYQYVSKLIIYRNTKESGILYALSAIIKELEEELAGVPIEELRDKYIAKIYEQINKLLVLATEYGFDKNLWQNYLAFLLAASENPFSISCEKKGMLNGSVNTFAKSDLKLWKELFHYDFHKLEERLGIQCFSTITNYNAIEKSEKRYNKSVSDKIKLLSEQLSFAVTEGELLRVVTNFYCDYGVGKYGLNKAFRLREENGRAEIAPILNTEEILLSDLIGYELQKKKLIENTEAFVKGKKANNCLLYGDSGTGKSSSVKAILNEYCQSGLRIIEIYKHQFQYLSEIIAEVKNRNYKFIIYMDDLSFEEFEIEYKYLKAVIEGGLETRPDNVLIYATSNRRHLIRETWSDRSDMSKDELHKSDTMQEKLSLVARFGITINYSTPAQKEFFEIVKGLAKKQKGIELTEEELLRKANIWEMSHGGRSGRTAQQFVNYLLGIKE
jgi:predicted AAA+ superfamily ATPase